MYAIIETGGFQYRVEAKDHINIPHLKIDVGDEIQIDKVLLLADGEDIKVGTPTVPNVYITAEVIAHGKDKKIKVYDYRRRGGFKKKSGHRQQYTELKIKQIVIE